MNAWTAFWIAVAVFIAAELVLVLHGIDTFLWQFKTEPEKAIQRKLGGIARAECTEPSRISGGENAPGDGGSAQ